MRVRQGWSGEVQPGRWVKFDIELEEEDLRRLLAGADVSEEAQADVSLRDAYQLLEIEAEYLVLVKLISRYGYAAEQGRKKLGELAAAQTALIAGLK